MTVTADADGLERAALCLTRFAHEFVPPDRQDQSNITLKLNHCLRVFREAEAIVAGERLDRETSQVALWAALFHDVGRFPQYARHGTFDDRKSEDHGRLGVRVLKERDFLHPLPPLQKKAVMAAVILHNRRFLPQGLPGRIALPARVVRDADKLDIFAVMLAHLRPGAPANHVVTLGLRDDPAAYTPAIILQIMQGRLADSAKMVWINDFRLLLCSWIYDLNFTASRRTVLERGFVEELLAPLPDTPDIRRVAQKIRTDIAIQAHA
jgi:putative nucleotidyltransferase with HDIG domain